MGHIALVLFFDLYQIVQAGHIGVAQDAVHQHQSIFQTGIRFQSILPNHSGTEIVYLKVFIVLQNHYRCV